MTARPPSGSGWDFVVSRTDLRRREVRESVTGDLDEGEIRLRVDSFALTANNLTYAVTGDRFGYWELFPASDGWGRIPAWGVVTVEASACADVSVGERLTGMVPMSTGFTARPRPTRDGFADRTAHRAAADPVYSRYVRVTDRDEDDLERDVALRPVFTLSFVLAQHLQATSWRGARRVLVTSASSKASLGLAHVLGTAAVRVTGLTSASHRAGIEAVGCYDDVVDYDHLDRLSNRETTVLLDLHGNPTVRDTVMARLGASLVDTVRVGQTDWDQAPDQVLGQGSAAFFAPTVITQLVSDWGAVEFGRRLDEALQSFVARSHRWLHVDHRDGRTGVTTAFDDVAAGAVSPDRFAVVRPHGARHLDT